MTNQLTTFDFNTLSVRTLQQNEQPWFVAADLCKAIGFALRSNGTINVNNIRGVLSDDETITCRTGKTGRPSLCISESGLYS